ncbi:hypothetical protein CANCADRAFT_96812 [Tortispora caseinolytica NRRL Y-17796]|uniref:Squalene synthase n=1 Tax=Tortispora caseinolytica NRRL Y-17796 TaxID=767744 RepID=A0A1E4TDW9_9ASCO|nr:hypothetical protein CANCADRAFT_96812 [Tortispora caseinolytica NRRL Y-17796]
MNTVGQLLLHPHELKDVIQYKLYHERLHPWDLENEPEDVQECYKLLKMTSRSFVRVIEDLNPELRKAIMIFYLVLRALDTIEDDMTIPNEVKVPILNEFYTYLDRDEYHFDGNGPNEKDRLVLVEFNYILREYKKLKKPYQALIQSNCQKMGEGMAKYCEDKQFNSEGIKTLAQYDEYCYYVAAIVGVGLTEIMLEADFINPAIKEHPELVDSMGKFLQKTNIIRDYREDLEDGRVFWPSDIWAKYTKNNDISEFTKPDMIQNALYCNSELVCDALRHAPDCLLYLTCVKDQSLFDFCAIPQVMAIATLELIFRNPEMFKRNVKIRKGTAVSLIYRARSVRSVCEIFLEYAQRIHERVTSDDPNYLAIEIAYGKIQQTVESIFPSQLPVEGKVVSTAGMSYQQIQTLKKRGPNAKNQEQPSKSELVNLYAAFGLSFLLIFGSLTLAAWMMGARFDLVWGDISKMII